MQIVCREPVWWVYFLSCHSEMIPAPILFTLWSFKPKLLLFFPSSLWGLVCNEDHQTGHFASATFAYMMCYVNVISATLKNVLQSTFLKCTSCRDCSWFVLIRVYNN